MKKLLLGVPFYRQNDVKSEINSYWQRRVCGLLGLKMVLDYYTGGKSTIDVVKLFEEMVDSGAMAKSGNWYNWAFVKEAIRRGYRAWRRNWLKSEADIESFRKEGVDEKSIEQWQEQEKSEAIPTLVNSLEAKQPVMVSVAKDFDEVDSPHLVVLTGIQYGDKDKIDGFYYNDPYSPETEDRKDRFIALKTFKAKWNWRAIFIVPGKK